jgi:predicted MPP superfamily phosphohydrolase
MSIFLIILFSIPLLSLVWWYWADCKLKRLGAGRHWRIFVSLCSALLLAGFIWVVLSRREVIQPQVPGTLYAAVLLWALLFLPFLAVPTMLVWSLVSIARRLSRGNPQEQDFPRAWTRRDWLKTTLASSPMGATLVATLVSIPQVQRVRVRDLTVNLPDLPAALDGLRIAHLTDTHVGKFTKGAVIDEIIKKTNALSADLILFTGDLIDNTLRDLPEAVSMLQKLQARSGLFVVEGNHDLFDSAEAFVNGVRSGGIHLLRNQSAIVEIRGEEVQILGILWNRRESAMARDVDAVASLRSPLAFPILLAHHPHAYDRAAQVGIPLTLAGHTHGGQLMLTETVGAGPAMFRYWSGIYQENGRALVVGNGTGNWFPLRVNAPAEIIHLTLRKA